MQSAEASEQVYSRLADDPDLEEQVEQFVATAPRILLRLHECAEGRDWRSLARVARQLRGSSACYGFDAISARSGRLETACRQAQNEREILAALDDLDQLCGRLRPRNPPR